MIVGLDHVQLAMPKGGEDTARAFYTGVLGMAEGEKPAHLKAHGGCWFHAAGVDLHLGVEDAFRPAGKAHPALLVDDLGAVRAGLERHEIDFLPGLPLEGYARGDIRDPFGNRIELMQKI